MTKSFKAALLVLLALAAIFVLTGCGETSSKNPLVGNWKNDSYGTSFIYTFNEDGTGKYDAAGTIMEFTYTTDGNQISILYTGNTEAFETEYSIDGDTLNVKDSVGKDTLYQKIK